MAYRRKQVVSRSSTFKEDINTNTNGQHELLDDNEPNSAPPIINTNSLAAQAIKASAARRHPSHSFALLNSSNSSLQHDNHHRSKSFDSYGDASKSGFWGVLAQKAKEILEDDHDHDTQKLRSYSFNIPPGARTQDGRTIGESKLKGCEDSNQLIWNPWQQQSTNSHSSIHETQLKASRDVAMATAAKAKLLLRELKTVKADFVGKCLHNFPPP